MEDLFKHYASLDFYRDEGYQLVKILNKSVGIETHFKRDKLLVKVEETRTSQNLHVNSIIHYDPAIN